MLIFLGQKLEFKSNTLKSPNQKASSYHNQIPNECDNLFSRYARLFSTCSLQIGFSSSQKAAQLSGFFTREGVK